MSDEDEHTPADALRATAWDVRQLATRHGPELRRIGLDDLADKTEDLARNTQAVAEEHYSPRD